MPVVVRRAIDARRGRVQFRVRVALGESADLRPPSSDRVPRDVKGSPQVVVIGDGPAGLFAPTNSRATGFGRSSWSEAKRCNRAGTTSRVFCIAAR